MSDLIQVNQQEALTTLDQVDQLLSQAEQAVEKAGDCFIDVSFLLLKIKQNAFWIERGYKSEHEYIENSFPQSRAQYYRLIRCGRNLQTYDRAKLKRWGSSKCEDLVRLHVHFKGEVPADWFESIDSDNKDTFRRRVRNYMDSMDKTKKLEEHRDPEEEDIFIKLRVFGNGINTVNLAFESAARALGSDKSMSYLFEMICANYNSQFADDGSGNVGGNNAYILQTIEGLIRQLNFNIPETSERLIGIVAKGVEENVATQAAPDEAE